MTAGDLYGRFTSARDAGDDCGMVSVLSDAADADDGVRGEFADMLSDPDADLRELTAVRVAAGSYDVLSDGRVVGKIENRMHDFVFYSYETPMGPDYPYVRDVGKIGWSWELDPDDERVVGTFELFDRDVRRGSFIADDWTLHCYIGSIESVRSFRERYGDRS